MTAYIFITTLFHAFGLFNGLLNLGQLSDREEITGEELNKTAFYLALSAPTFFCLYGMLLLLSSTSQGLMVIVYTLLIFLWSIVQLAACQTILNHLRRGEVSFLMTTPFRAQASMFAVTGVFLWSGYWLLTFVF